MSHSPAEQQAAYPPAPWQMVGQLFCSLLRLPEAVDASRPAGLYGAAFVAYEPGSPLTYSELLVARPVRSGRHGRRIEITDIWVDSPGSMAGGRGLWAIPKGLCDFTLEATRTGPLSRTEWSASLQRRPIARARFTDVSRGGVRLPFRAGILQPGIAETAGEERTATMAGTAKALPCRGAWEFDTDGPLGWLRAARPVASFRMADFAMSFG